MLLGEQMDIIRKHQQTAPVQTVPIAEDLGVQVYRVASWTNNISGMLRKDPDSKCGYSIYVNANHPTVRRRFTIAHEIAHFVLHETLLKDGIVEDALLRAEGLSNRIEAQANSMAADILMPWHLIKPMQDAGITTVEELARQFEVSNDAMSIRVLGLSYQRAREIGVAG